MVYRPDLTNFLAAACIMAHFIFLPQDRIKELIFVAITGGVGLGMDTALAYAGLMSFYPTTLDQIYPPLWLVLLWISFACTLRHSLGWIFDRWYVAIGLGSVGGALTYLGADKLGAIEILMPSTQATAYFLVLWGLLFTFYWWVFQQMESR